MINDQDRFQQDKSPYERPNFPFRCGRIRIWGKPCSRGPGVDGACGGVSECQPFKNGDRWECRRPASAGGPCANGPDSQGACAIQAPPCRPMRSVRGYRGRLSMLVLAFVVAIIAAFGFGYDDGAGALNTTSPGGLSGAHENFTKAIGCVACHDAHDKPASQWIQAAWSPGNLSEKCSTCHAFGGPAQSPHNKTFKTNGASEKTDCVMCHTEHKGAAATVVAMSDKQCNACHEKKFDSFSKGHPTFSKDFPSRRRTAIAFNHTSHFDKHFQNKRFVDKAPKQRCVACHDTAAAGRNVPVQAFEKTCAACHENQIAERDLHLLTFPEFEKNPFDPAEILAACGPTKAAQEETGALSAALAENLAKFQASGSDGSKDIMARVNEMKTKLGLGVQPADAEEFESVSTETLPPLAVLLLGLEDDGDDPESYTDPVRDIINAMIETGDAAVLEMLSERTDSAKQLLAGLSPELARSVACAWAGNQEYEAPSEPALGGWFADALALKYRPVRHGDPVVRGWLDLAAGGDVPDDASDIIFSKSEGVGACAKCHSVSSQGGTGEAARVEWRFGAKSDQRHVRYEHKPHLNLLGPGASCETCHKIDPEAAYDAAFKQADPLKFSSNFKSIENKTCSTCHATDRVKQECTLCHEYHNEHGFQKKMVSATRQK
jgi:hypothetical protein